MFRATEMAQQLRELAALSPTLGVMVWIGLAQEVALLGSVALLE